MSERPSEPVHARGLGRAAFEPPPEGQSYQPLIPATESPAEFTFKAVVFGILFGVVFGAANAYLGLVAGLTISTSIPVAVLTVAAFRVLRSLQVQSSLLEANLAQTIGSASSSVASGVIFTLPALFLWNLDPTLLQMVLLALCGGLLGVLFMVPLRRYLIDREHGKLPYPEGTACAEVLVASRGEAGGSARNVFYGLGAGILVKTFYGGLKLLPETVKSAVPLLPKGELGLKLSSALFGVGFILGPRIGAVMVSGALLSSLVLIPGIFWLWGGRPDPVYPELVKTVVDMSPSELWNRYVRYIGAGAVATAGLITLVKSIPTMIQSFKVGAEQLQQRLQAGQDAAEEPRTRQDLPLKWIGVAVAGLALVMAAILVLIQHIVQAREEGALNEVGQYCLDNLINRLYEE